jgi:hypothetical protein
LPKSAEAIESILVKRNGRAKERTKSAQVIEIRWIDREHRAIRKIRQEKEFCKKCLLLAQAFTK